VSALLVIRAVLSTLTVSNGCSETELSAVEARGVVRLAVCCEWRNSGAGGTRVITDRTVNALTSRLGRGLLGRKL
jgi:hypothetical protein